MVVVVVVILVVSVVVVVKKKYARAITRFFALKYLSGKRTRRNLVSASLSNRLTPEYVSKK